MVVLDNKENADSLQRAAQARGLQLQVLVDVDGGQGRTGVKPEHGLELAKYVHSMTNLRLRGVQCYIGNLQHVKDFQERAQRYKVGQQQEAKGCLIVVAREE